MAATGGQTLGLFLVAFLEDTVGLKETDFLLFPLLDPAPENSPSSAGKTRGGGPMSDELSSSGC